MTLLNIAKIEIDYTSNWEEGLVETYAILNLKTGEIDDIKMSDEGEKYEFLIEETIYVNNKSYEVERDERGYEYSVSESNLADIISRIPKEASEDQVFGMSEEEILVYLKDLNYDELHELMEKKSYAYDENESTSRNIRIFAEDCYKENVDRKNSE